MFNAKITLQVVFSIIVSAALCITPLGDIFAIMAALIGLFPVTLFFWFLPTISVYLLAVIAIIVVFALFRVRSLLISLPVAIGMVGVTTWVTTNKVNETLNQRAALLMRDDHDLAAPVAPISVLAVVEDQEQSKQPICTDLCQRALLNRVVDAIVMIRVESTAQTLNQNWPGTLYRLQEQSSCPSQKDVPEYHDEIAGDLKGYWPSRSAAVALRIEAAKGHCLVSEAARLRDADAVIVEGMIKRETLSYDVNWDVYADNASARRVQFFRRENGRYEERYRSTRVEVQSWLPAMLFASSNPMQLRWQPRWVRKRQVLDVKPFAQDIDSPLSFARARLGFDLRLDQSRLGRELRAIMDDAAAGTRSFPAQGDRVLEAYLEEIAKRQTIPPADLELSLRLLAEPRVPLGIWARGVVTGIVGTSPTLATRVASSLFARLSAASRPDTLMTESERHSEITSVAAGIKALPDSALLPHFEALVSLSRNEDVWGPGHEAIVKLSVFGDKAVPALIDVIDRASALGRSPSGKELDWREPMTGAMQALCWAGPSARTALPLLQQRVQGDMVAGIPMDAELVKNTLSRLSTDVADTPDTRRKLSGSWGPCS